MVIDFHAALGKFMDQAPKGEVTLRPIKKPVAVHST